MLCIFNLIIILHILCTIAHDGDFCEADADGCAVTSCLEGQMCIDNAAPLSGAQCTCPGGYSSIDSKYDGMHSN